MHMYVHMYLSASNNIHFQSGPLKRWAHGRLLERRLGDANAEGGCCRVWTHASARARARNRGKNSLSFPKGSRTSHLLPCFSHWSPLSPALCCPYPAVSSLQVLAAKARATHPPAKAVKAAKHAAKENNDIGADILQVLHSVLFLFVFCSEPRNVLLADDGACQQAFWTRHCNSSRKRLHQVEFSKVSSISILHRKDHGKDAVAMTFWTFLTVLLGLVPLVPLCPCRVPLAFNVSWSASLFLHAGCQAPFRLKAATTV